jgi:hypothetical protein
MVIIAGLGLSGAVVTASIYAQHGSVRDRSSKDALAAADAGVQLALYRQNKITTTSALPCVVQATRGSLVPGGAAGRRPVPHLPVELLRPPPARHQLRLPRQALDPRRHYADGPQAPARDRLGRDLRERQPPAGGHRHRPRRLRRLRHLQSGASSPWTGSSPPAGIERLLGHGEWQPGARVLERDHPDPNHAGQIDPDPGRE